MPSVWIRTSIPTCVSFRVLTSSLCCSAFVWHFYPLMMHAGFILVSRWRRFLQLVNPPPPAMTSHVMQRGERVAVPTKAASITVWVFTWWETLLGSSSPFSFERMNVWLWSHQPWTIETAEEHPSHGSSGRHWLVTMCLCLIDCEMVCCCTAVSHLRPTKVIDWFGHVECSQLVHSNAFFSHSWITSTGRRIVGLGRRQRPSGNIFLFTPPPPFLFTQLKKIQIGWAEAPDYTGRK